MVQASKTPAVTLTSAHPARGRDRLLVLEMVRATDAAAIAAGRLIGRGDEVGGARGEGPRIDIALDPLEGTTISAKAGTNALVVPGRRRPRSHLFARGPRARRLHLRRDRRHRRFAAAGSEREA